ncbi:MAG: DMT family transporter [Chloroflexi bacterium]|nr:DMT family transporter [Chloroflexota bacterium]
MLGSLLALLAGTAWGTSSVFARFGLQYLRPVQGSVISMFARLAILAFLSTTLEPQAWVELPWKALLLFAGVGILNFPLALFFNYSGIQKVGASRAAPIIASSPIFAMLLALVFLGETPTPITVLGAISIFAGLYLITSSEPR